jgi:hypothetical protein
MTEVKIYAKDPENLYELYNPGTILADQTEEEKKYWTKEWVNDPYYYEDIDINEINIRYLNR